MTRQVLVAAILSLQPRLPEPIAVKFADNIQETTSDESDAAILIVNAFRESGFGLGCIQGIGGRGSYGLGVGYERYACRSLKIQTVMSLQALYDKGWASDETKGIRGYLGALSDTWPEIGIRKRLWALTDARIRCRCSL